MRLRGGANIGWEFWGWPLAKILVSSECVHVSIPCMTYKIDRKDIELVSEYRNLCNRGVYLHHRCEEIPKTVAFFHPSRRKAQALRAAFEERQYLVRWAK
jgi:hypothetical protein